MTNLRALHLDSNLLIAFPVWELGKFKQVEVPMCCNQYVALKHRFLHSVEPIDPVVQLVAVRVRIRQKISEIHRRQH